MNNIHTGYIDSDPENYYHDHCLRANKSDTLMLWIPGYHDYFKHKHIFEYMPVFRHVDILPLYYGKWNIHKSVAYDADNISDYIEALDEILFHLPFENYKKIILYGHSMGGTIAIHYAHRGRYRNKVNMLMLNDPLIKWYTDHFILDNVHFHPLSWNLDGYYLSFNKNAILKTWPYSYAVKMTNKCGYINPKIPNTPVLLYAGHVHCFSTAMNYIQQSDKALLNNRRTLILLSGGVENNPKGLCRLSDVYHYSNRISNNVTFLEISTAFHDVFFPKNTNEFAKLNDTIETFIFHPPSETELIPEKTVTLHSLNGTILWFATTVMYVFTVVLLWLVWRTFRWLYKLLYKH
ncbi:alpha/beta fold hydrolase [Chlamydiia bacterium]|nr:alpha/beta fold hydrolase [Chlamydiia bacterium]